MIDINLSPWLRKDLKKVQKRPQNYGLTIQVIKLLKERGMKGLLPI